MSQHNNHKEKSQENQEVKTENHAQNSQNQQESKQENNQQNQDSAEEIAKKKIAELETKTTDLNDKLLRTLAELDNVRRRSREEVEKAHKYAVTNFVSELVLVVENFFLATQNKPTAEIEKNSEIKHFADAILMTQNELIKILEKNSIKRIYPLGEKFDHNFHEAMSQTESHKENGTILQVLQAGYVISDRLIRPALVVVAKNNN